MNNRKITIPIIIVLVLAIISLGIAFATFSTTLNINGNAEVQASNWDIYFTTAATGGLKPQSSTSMPSNTITPTGTVTSATASIVATTFTWSANFKSPGDKVVYTIYVKNGGSYNAKVTSISTPAIQCTTDPKNACYKLSYGLYTDASGTTELTTSFTVDAGDTETFYLIAKLADDYGGTSGENLAGSDVTTSQISATVTFGQEGVSSSSGGNSGGTSGGNSGGSSGGSSSSSSTKYLSSQTWNSETEEYEYVWIDSIGDISYQRKDVYSKKVGDTLGVCMNVNSTEYCFDENTTGSSFAQTCSSMGGYIVDGTGSSLGAEPDEFGEGYTCSNVQIIPSGDGGMTNWDEYDANVTYNIEFDSGIDYGKSVDIDKYYTGQDDYESCLLRINAAGSKRVICTYTDTDRD